MKRKIQVVIKKVGAEFEARCQELPEAVARGPNKMDALEKLRDIITKTLGGDSGGGSVGVPHPVLPPPHKPISKPENPWGESLPIKLLRDGWTPNCFPNSTVMVALPPGVTVQFDDRGVLHGFARGLRRFITATLHTNPKFTQSKELALKFVENLAKKKGAEPIDVATYRYFIDPTQGHEDSRIITFCVIGIPGAVVVVSLSHQPDSPPSELIESIRHAIPYIVGEVV